MSNILHSGYQPTDSPQNGKAIPPQGGSHVTHTPEDIGHSKCGNQLNDSEKTDDSTQATTMSEQQPTLDPMCGLTLEELRSICRIMAIHIGTLMRRYESLMDEHGSFPLGLSGTPNIVIQALTTNIGRHNDAYLKLCRVYCEQSGMTFMEDDFAVIREK